MLNDGSLLGTAGHVSGDKCLEAHIVAAILSNAWGDYERAGAKMHGGALKMIIVDCQAGRIGFTRVGERHVVAAFGKNVKSSVLKENLIRLYSALDPTIKSLEQFTTYV
mmetsp:Transcript_35572/g.56936  ORF Transcript_35572/g.56936 Transcript_35572/m.56936 type:complete len:109 (-) Transcript_35572:1025-1351(-)